MPNSIFPHHLGLTHPRLYSSYDRANNNINNNIKVIYGLIGINVAVWGYAQYTKAQAQAGHMGPFNNYMRNMSCNLTDVLRNGTFWTPLTSTFSHLDIFHVGSNMLGTYFIGKFMCYLPVITPAHIVTITLGAGVTGSMLFLFQRYMAIGGSSVDYKRGLGFSGALMGLTTVAACLSPSTKFYIYGIVPVPLWGLALGYAFYDGYYLNNPRSQIGHAGHLGGSLFGVWYYVLRLRGWKG